MKLFVLTKLFMGDLSFPKLESVLVAVQWFTPAFTSPEAALKPWTRIELFMHT